MQEITEDKWDEDIWGATEPTRGYKRPKLILYFGQKDHWVADHLRDELIQTRANQKCNSKPMMLIDESGIPHAFCISELMSWTD